MHNEMESTSRISDREHIKSSLRPLLTMQFRDLSLRVHVPNNWVLGIWVIVVMVQVWGKYTIIGHLDP